MFHQFWSNPTMFVVPDFSVLGNFSNRSSNWLRQKHGYPNCSEELRQTGAGFPQGIITISIKLPRTLIFFRFNQQGTGAHPVPASRAVFRLSACSALNARRRTSIFSRSWREAAALVSRIESQRPTSLGKSIGWSSHWLCPKKMGL